MTAWAPGHIELFTHTTSVQSRATKHYVQCHTSSGRATNSLPCLIEQNISDATTSECRQSNEMCSRHNTCANIYTTWPHERHTATRAQHMKRVLSFPSVVQQHKRVLQQLTNSLYSSAHLTQRAPDGTTNDSCATAKTQNQSRMLLGFVVSLYLPFSNWARRL